MNKSKDNNGSGFDMPKDYFEQLEINISVAEMEAALPETTGFSVPSNYFNTIENKLVEKIKGSETGTVIQLYQRTWFQITSGIAACFLIGLLIFNNETPTTSSTIEEFEIATLEVVDYFEDYSTSIDTEDVAALLTDDELDDITLENDLLSSSNIEDYLLDNLDDTSLLIE